MGTVSEPVVTVQGVPAVVGADNTFRRTAPLAPGTNTLTVKATDASGNAATQQYEVDSLGTGRTTRTPDGERWRYSMTVERKEHVKLLGVIPMPSRRSVRTFEVAFLIRDGLVADVTFHDSGPR